LAGRGATKIDGDLALFGVIVRGAHGRELRRAPLRRELTILIADESECFDGIVRLASSAGSSRGGVAHTVHPTKCTTPTEHNKWPHNNDRITVQEIQSRSINGLIELARRVARGFRDPDNYRLRMLLIGGGLRL
jgi:hypothetical protein